MNLINAKKSWRKSEETILTECVNEALQRGDDIEIGYDEASKRLGRTPRACRDHWNLIYKKRRKTQVKQVEHDYMSAFNAFTAAYANVESILRELVEENERLREIERRYNEASKHFKTS